MKKKTLALALLGVGLFSTSLLYEQVAEANDNTQSIAPFGVTDEIWNGILVTTDTDTQTITFQLPNGGSGFFPQGEDGKSPFLDASWKGGVTPSQIKHIKFKLRAGEPEPKIAAAYNYFSTSDSTISNISYTYHYFFAPFENVETITGLENVMLDIIFENNPDGDNYTNFFSGVNKVKMLDISQIVINGNSLSPMYFNQNGFLQNIPDLEVLVLSGDASRDLPYPEDSKISSNDFEKYRWTNSTKHPKFFAKVNLTNALDFSGSDQPSKLREITFNSERTPLSGVYGQNTGLHLNSAYSWVLLDKPQHEGGRPKKVNGKFQIINAEQLRGRNTNKKAETWALNTWGITEDDDSGFKPINPGDPIPGEPSTPSSPLSSKANSNININLTLDDSDVSGDPIVINPNNPGSNPEVIDGDKSPGSQGNGMRDFYINWVSDLDFGNIPITGDDISATANKITITPKEIAPYTVSPFIQVTDKSGKRNGWKLTVKGSPLQNEFGDTVPEASVVLGEGVVSQSNSKNQPSIKPNFTASNKNILSGQDVQVLTADKTVETGVWSVLFEKDGSPTSKFTIPKGTSLKKGHYVSTLTWILRQEPNKEG